MSPVVFVFLQPIKLEHCRGRPHNSQMVRIEKAARIIRARSIFTMIGPVGNAVILLFGVLSVVQSDDSWSLVQHTDCVGSGTVPGKWVSLMTLGMEIGITCDVCLSTIAMLV